MICKCCGKEITADAHFCNYCGKPVATPGGHGSAQTDKPLKTARRYSLVQRSVFGTHVMVGALSIYEDRVEFAPEKGNIGSAFGPAGLVVSPKIKPPVRTYRMEDIADAKVDKFAVHNRLIIRMKDGTVVPLAPAVPGSKEPEEIVELIKLYL